MAKLNKREIKEDVENDVAEIETVEEEVEDTVTAEVDETELDESAASDTLKPNSKPVGPANKSFKSVAIGQVVNAMAGMDKETINKFVATIAQIGHEGDLIPGSDASKNVGTLSTKPSGAGVQLVTKLESTEVPVSDLIAEDVSEIFAGEELTEEFKGKVAVLIESVINLKVDQRLASIEEEYAEKYEEEVATISENLVATMDDFLGYAAEEWVKKNEVAIVSNLRSDLVEDFVVGLKALFETHYIEVPEDKVDIIEEMNQRIEALELETSEKIDEIQELRTAILQKEGELAVEEMTKGLTESDAEKLREMAESVEFESADDLKSKVNILKEQYFKADDKNETSGKTSVLFEENEKLTDEEETPKVRGTMAAYVSAIGRQARR